MANERNLIPNNLRSKKEVRANAAKGGKKSGEVRRIKKTFKELAQQILEMQVGDDKVKEFAKRLFPKIPEKYITNRLAILASTTKEAIKGNMKAVEVLRDTAGEKPIDKLDPNLKDLNFNFNIEIIDNEIKNKNK